MVPLGRELVSSRAVNTNHPCIWYRLAAICDARFDWGLRTNTGGRMGSEMGPTNSPGTTSYKLLIVTLGLSLTVFRSAPGVPDSQIGGRNWSSKWRHYAGVSAANTNAKVIEDTLKD